MKKILTLFLFLFTLLPLSAQKVKIESPVFLGTILVNKLDNDEISETCNYYGFTKSGEEDGYIVYTSSDGTKIRTKFNGDIPFIEISTKEKPSQVKKHLNTAGYQKLSSGSYRKARSHCTLKSSPTSLLITKLPKSNF